MGQCREDDHRKDAPHFNISVYISMKDRSSVVLIGLILFLGESKIALGTFARNSVEILSDFFVHSYMKSPFLVHFAWTSPYYLRTPYKRTV